MLQPTAPHGGWGDALGPAGCLGWAAMTANIIPLMTVNRTPLGCLCHVEVVVVYTYQARIHVKGVTPAAL